MATGFGKWLEDLKKTVGGIVGDVDDFLVPGKGRASDVAKGAVLGFDTAARNTAADVSGLLGLNQASRNLQQRADRQRQFLNTNPTMNVASQFGSLLNAPGNFAYNAAFKPGFNTVNNAALATASAKQGLDPSI